jgi:hypothetical protein
MGYLQKPYDEEWATWVRENGILKLRQGLLRRPFFQKLFKCYFCLGVWCGPVAHIFCRDLFGEQYFLNHPSTLWWWVRGIAAAALLGATTNLIIDSKVISRQDY